MRNNLAKRSVVIDLKQPAGPRPGAAPGTALRRGGRELPGRRGGAARAWPTRHRGRASRAWSTSPSRASGGRSGRQPASPYDGWPAFASIVEAMSGVYEFKRPQASRRSARPWVGWATSGPRCSPSSACWPPCASATPPGAANTSTSPCSTPWSPCSTSCPTSGRWGMPMGTPWPRILHGFRRRDGWFMVQVLRAHQWPDLARAVGRPEWADDPRFATPQGWRAHLESDIRPAVETWAADRPSGRQRRANAAGLVAGPAPPTTMSSPTPTWPIATCWSSTRAPTASTSPSSIPGSR